MYLLHELYKIINAALLEAEYGCSLEPIFQIFNSDQQGYVQHMLSIYFHYDVQQKKIKPLLLSSPLLPSGSPHPLLLPIKPNSTPHLPSPPQSLLGTPTPFVLLSKPPTILSMEVIHISALLPEGVWNLAAQYYESRITKL
jgi:hypothetical protein